MEAKNITPNYNEKEENNNGNLREELENLLEIELEKSPDDINTKKISSIIQLLDEMDGRRNDDSIDKDEFAKKYLHNYIRVPKKAKVYKFSQRKMHLASAILIFAVLFGLGNYVSVRATNQGILTNVKEQIGVFYYEIVKKDAVESSEYEKFSDVQENNELLDKKYNSWKEVKAVAEHNFRTPSYIPEEFIGESIHYQTMGNTEFIISRSYYKEDGYIRFFIKSFSDNGKWSAVVDDVETILYEKTIGDVFVTCYQIEENNQAIFQEDIFIYEIETNLNEAEIEKIILNMR